jgi:hypothetical protein
VNEHFAYFHLCSERFWHETGHHNEGVKLTPVERVCGQFLIVNLREELSALRTVMAGSSSGFYLDTWVEKPIGKAIAYQISSLRHLSLESYKDLC